MRRFNSFSPSSPCPHAICKDCFHKLSLMSLMESSVNTETNRFLSAALSGDLKLLKRLAYDVDMGDGLCKTVGCIRDDDGRTAFHLAAMRGKTHVCKYLLEEVKVDVDLSDGIGETPLHCAILEDHYPTVVYLLENGANPNAATSKGFTPIHYAAKKGYKKLLHLLISKGAEVDAKADSGTPLQLAVRQVKKEAVKILLDNHADPNLILDHTISPLLTSILSGSVECVKLLLKAGADPNLGSNDLAPIDLAASEGETEIIKCLLKAGANPNVVNVYGLTPVEVAALNGHCKAVIVLFPVTTSIPSILDWSCAGIMMHVRSEEAKSQRRNLKLKGQFFLSKSKGKDAFMRKDYTDAIFWYTQASYLDPLDAVVLSNRSLCWVRLNEGERALTDAQACVMLRPDWPKAHYREGVAWKLLKDMDRAAGSFLAGLQLEPENKELGNAFREVVEALTEAQVASMKI